MARRRQRVLGSKDNNVITNKNTLGKLISNFRFSSPRIIYLQAWSPEMIPGIENVFFWVRAVSTNPGRMSDTEMPLGPKSMAKVRVK